VPLMAFKSLTLSPIGGILFQYFREHPMDG
jgi:hypothetical protein